MVFFFDISRRACGLVAFFILFQIILGLACSAPAATGGDGSQSMSNANVSEEPSISDDSSEAITVRGPDRAGPGTEVGLDALLSTEYDSSTALYSWKQISGPEVILENEDSSYVKIKIPSVLADAELIVEVTISFQGPQDGKTITQSERFTISISSSFSNSNVTTDQFIIQASETNGTAPAEIEFMALLSDGTSPGEVQSFTWDLGDGHRTEGAKITHTYSTSGQYVVSLFARPIEYVTDNAIADAEAFIEVTSSDEDETSEFDLVVSPSGITSVTISESGNPDPSSWTYTLTNNGSSAIQWECQNRSSYIDITVDSGTLNGNKSVTVEAKAKSNASDIPGGFTTERLLFKDLTHSISIWRSVRFTSAEANESEEDEEESPVLEVNPSGTIRFEGSEGGPFSPLENQITLKNNHLSSVEWTASESADWLTLSSQSGSLGKEEETTLSLLLHENTPTSPAGVYQSELTITNNIDNEEYILLVELIIRTPDYTPPRFVPWIEVNFLDPISRYETAVEGINIWKDVTNTICVSTAPTDSTIRRLYSNLERDCPGVTIIPGIKTSSMFTSNDSYVSPTTGQTVNNIIRIDQVEGWIMFAEKLETICESTPIRQIIVENETTNKHLCWGYYEPNWENIEEGMRIINDCIEENNIELIWYPPIAFSSGSYARQMSVQFINLLNENVDSLSLVTFEWSMPSSPTKPRIQEAHALNVALGVPYYNVCYMMSLDDYAHWPYYEMPYLIENCPGENFFFLYTGGSQFVERATQIRELLLID